MHVSLNAVEESVRFSIPAGKRKNYPYLSAIRDTKEERSFPDLTQESEAEKWIKSTPDSFLLHS